MAWIFQTGLNLSHQTLADAVYNAATGSSLATLAVNAAGTGYNVGDILTITPGTFTVQGMAEVLTVGGGGTVTSVRIKNAGLYTVNPGTGAATTVSPAGGTGCTLNTTIASNNWVSQRSTNVGGAGDREVILKGTGLAGTDNIYVGFRTYNDATSGANAWEVAGFTGFSSGLTWINEPGISPGRYTDQTQSPTVPLASTGITAYWLSVNGRRIILVCKISTAYISMYLGFGNPFATTNEYPYPLIVGTPTNQWNALSSSSNPSLSSVADPTRHSNSDPASTQVRFTDGQWYSVYNSTNNAGSRTAHSTGFVQYPQISLTVGPTDPADAWYSISSLQTYAGAISETGSPGTTSLTLSRTPDGGSGLPNLFPCTIHTDSPSQNILAELDSVFWFSAVGGESPEDMLLISTDRYMVFKSGNRTDPWAFFAVKEN